MSPTHNAGRFSRHIAETASIAAPIAVAQLGQMAMGLTDTVMLGNIGTRALAAGGLGANFFFTCLFFLQGVVSGVAVLAARARGAGQGADVPAAYWSGMAIGALLSLPYFWLMSTPGPMLHLLGEPPQLAADITSYLHVLRWGVPAGLLGIGIVRAFLPAIGLQHLMLWVMPGGIAVNALLNVWLIHGGLGLPAFGMRGSAAATAVTLWLTAGALLIMLHGARNRHHVRLTAPRPAVLLELLAIGVPVGMTVLVEAALFLVTALVIGVLGPVQLAGHQVAIMTASVTFMVPLAIGQAANVRVAHAVGAGEPDAARRAGLVAIALAAAFMLCTAVVMEAAPRFIASLYLAAGSAALPVAATLLRIAGGFQIADGVQVAASGALRGLKDTRVPMMLAAIGYWGIGFWLGRYLCFNEGMGPAGLWWGLLAGLAVTALCLTARFVVMTGGRKARGSALDPAGALGPRPHYLRKVRDSVAPSPPLTCLWGSGASGPSGSRAEPWPSFLPAITPGPMLVDPLLIRQFLQFAVIGAFGFLWDTLIVYATTPLVGPYIAGVISFIIVGCINWMANRLWTYRHLNHDAMHRQLVRFLIANVVGFVLNRGTYSILIYTQPLFREYLVLPIAAGAGAGMFVNFFLSRRLVFR